MLHQSRGIRACGSGTLVISTMTVHNATGTFSFTGVDQNGNRKTVTGGTFNVTY